MTVNTRRAVAYEFLVLLLWSTKRRARNDDAGVNFLTVSNSINILHITCRSSISRSACQVVFYLCMTAEAAHMSLDPVAEQW